MEPIDGYAAGNVLGSKAGFDGLGTSFSTPEDVTNSVGDIFEKLGLNRDGTIPPLQEFTLKTNIINVTDNDGNQHTFKRDDIAKVLAESKDQFAGEGSGSVDNAASTGSASGFELLMTKLFENRGLSYDPDQSKF